MSSEHTEKSGQQTIRWWLALLMLTGLTLLLHFTGYNYDFPYTEEFDESRILWNAYARRIDRPDFENLQGYPPGIFWIHNAVQPVVEQREGNPAEFEMMHILTIIRGMAIITNAGTVIVIALATRMLAGSIAGLLAGFAWAVLPVPIVHTTLALTEAWQTFFITLAILTAFISLERQSRTAALASILAGLGAVLFKYSAFPALGPGVAAVLWNIYVATENRRKWLQTGILQIALMILCAAYLFLIYGAGQLDNPEQNRFIEDGIWSLLNIRELTQTATVTAAMMGMSLVALTGLLIAGSALYVNQHPDWRRIGWGIALIVFLVQIPIVNSFIVFDVGMPRYLTPVSATGAILIVAAVYITADTLARRIKQPALTAIIPAGFILLWLLPLIPVTLDYVTSHTRPTTTGALSSWTQHFLDVDEAVIFEHNIRYAKQGIYLFSRAQGGYQGDWIEMTAADLTSKPLATWQDEGFVHYIGDDDNLDGQPQADDYLDEMLLMKQFPPPGEEDNWRGSPLYFYRLWDMQHETDVTFGDIIRLAGFDLERTSFAPGETVQLTPYWQAVQQPDAAYSLYVHLYPHTERTVIAQADGPPAGTVRMTYDWDDPHEIIIGETRELTLPPDLAPGTYRLAIGLYHLDNGQRLLTDSGDDYVVLDTLTITGDGES